MHVGRLAAGAAALAAVAGGLLVGWPHRLLEAAPPPLEGVRAVEAWPGVAFGEPIALAHPRDGTDMLYVLEQPGFLKRLPKWRGVGEVPKPETVLDLSKKVHAQSQGGALGIAFHPQFRANGRFYVSYLMKNQHPTLLFKLVVSEFRMNNGTTSPATERVVLEVPKTRAVHQAGGIAFGPDGKLYIGIGDNGSEADREDNAQNPAGLMGKILRIDVDNPAVGKSYGIPEHNPWPKNPGVRPEIWAYGFRNPWRFSWDGNTMFAGEPGSKGPKCREWITEVVRGENHGWPYMEGNTRNPDRTDKPVSATPYVPRMFDYGREDPESGSCAIGGHVYRGDRVKALQGKYVFCDYMLEEVYAIDLGRQGNRWVGSNQRKVAAIKAVSIDTDAQGELYFCVNEKADSGGTVMTLAPK